MFQDKVLKLMSESYVTFYRQIMKQFRVPLSL